MNTTKKMNREYRLTTVNHSEVDSVRILSDTDAAHYCRQFYGEDISIYESFWAVYLNRANRTIGYAKIGQGGLNSCVVDLRIVCKYAIESLASSVIVVHNHPSGNLTPSLEDVRLSNRLFKALELLDIKLLDSLILTESSHTSYKERNN